MKHTIRQNGQLTQIDCELGSGIFDKHGKEIFEGDIVKIGGVRDYYVDCQYGVFCIRNNKGDAIDALRELDECYCEIVGHVTD